LSFGLCGLDYVALALFIVCWLGTDWLIAHRARRIPGVHDLIRPQRIEWMRQAHLRDIRIADAGLSGGRLKRNIDDAALAEEPGGT